MPLFTNKFSPKKIPVRKEDTSIIKKEFGVEYASRELSVDYDKVNLKLGEFDISFDDGQWIPVSGKAGAEYKENIKLKRAIKQLEEDNNMLRLKFEIILDMLTEKATNKDYYNQDDIKNIKNIYNMKNKFK